jgi:pimeloyl-ACP methyl ester carboxylesterase
VIETIRAGDLDVAYLDVGLPNGTPVILLHGFPYDVWAYDEVMSLLAEEGCRVIVPYLRGFGPTRFVSDTTIRSGQQAALARDLLALMDALEIDAAVLAGYDWGGRAACIVSALWPQRALGLVTGDGYNIQDIARSVEPVHPFDEWKLWYQYYFHGERGRRGLTRNRRELCRMLWRLWSPEWDFSEATFDRTASSFDNPDFVDVVVHSYRVRYGLVAGDPSLAATEERLAALPPIAVRAVVLDGGSDGVALTASSDRDAGRFVRGVHRQVVTGVGHNIPQEAPRVFADAVLRLLG